MNTWQDLLDYVDNVLVSFDPTHFQKARYGNELLLSLANEAFDRLKALNRVSFVPNYSATGVKSIQLPAACDGVEEVYLRGKKALRTDLYKIQRVCGQCYYVDDTQLVFKEPITFNAGELVIIGKGQFSELVKSRNATSPFSVLNNRSHELIAWYMLANLPGDMKDPNTQARIELYTRKFENGLKEYEWNNVKRRCEKFKALPVPTTCFKGREPLIKITQNIVYTFKPEDYYTKEEVDAKDTAVLSAAEARAVRAEQTAENYTNTYTGDINQALDEIRGEDE